MTSAALLTPPQLNVAPGHETHLKRASPMAASLPPDDAPGYYDIPLLKRPVWKWEVASYFFLGGLSAGAYVMARLADRFGDSGDMRVRDAGMRIAVAAAVPCAPLLIADLGDPKRFHHMLRVFKPNSPMNLGSWTLTAYTNIVFVTLARDWSLAKGRGGVLRRFARALLGSRLLGIVLDAAGMPLALLLTGYTGVLLSATATPVWSKNAWLGPLFTASAISNGVSALKLTLAAAGPGSDQASEKALEKIGTAAHVAEAVTITGYLATTKDAAKPLTHGKHAPLFLGAAAGMVAAEVLGHIGGTRRTRRWSMLAGALVGLAGGFALKWAMLHAGPESAQEHRP